MLLSRTALRRHLLFILLFLVVCNALSYALRPFAGNHIILDQLLHRFDMDMEYTIPSWFSSMLLALSALLTWIISHTNKGPIKHYEWKALSILMLILSADELIMLHEIPRDWLAGALGISSGLFINAWLLLAIPFCIAVAFLFEHLLRHLPAHIRMLFLLAGGVFVFGAVGMEMIDGWYGSVFGKDILYYSLTTLEEGLEILGLIIFIDALVAFMKENDAEFLTD